MKVSNENKQAIYESVMNALSKTVKGVLDKKVNESKEIEDVYYAKTSDGKYVIYLIQHLRNKHSKLYIAMCAHVLDSYSRKFKHGGAFDTTNKGDIKIKGEYAEDLFRTERYYINDYDKNIAVTKSYNSYYNELKRMFEDYIDKYSIKTYDEFITNLDKDGSPLLEVFDEVKIEQSQNKNSSDSNDIPTDALPKKINGFDKKTYINYRKDLTYEYENLLSRIDNLDDSNAKVYAIMYLNYINGYYQNLIERLMPLNPLKAIKILNELAKVTQKYIVDDVNFGQK